MKTVRFHPEALVDLVEAAEWCEARSRVAAQKLLAEVDAAVALLPEFPRKHAIIVQSAHSAIIRSAPVHRFPYALVYADLDDQILIAAVAHVRRRPLYWVGRLATV